MIEAHLYLACGVTPRTPIHNIDWEKFADALKAEYKA